MFPASPGRNLLGLVVEDFGETLIRSPVSFN